MKKITLSKDNKLLVNGQNIWDFMREFDPANELDYKIMAYEGAYGCSFAHMLVTTGECYYSKKAYDFCAKKLGSVVRQYDTIELAASAAMK